MDVNVNALDWRRSARCSGGSCVETAFDPGFAYVRDSKDRDRAVLRFGHGAWRDFVDGLKRDAFSPR